MPAIESHVAARYPMNKPLTKKRSTVDFDHSTRSSHSDTGGKLNLPANFYGFPNIVYTTGDGNQNRRPYQQQSRRTQPRLGRAIH